MTRRTLFIVFIVAWVMPLAFAQEAADPVTGKWGRDDLTYLDLTFDGKSAVSGTVIWRDRSSGYEEQAPIKTGTFDLKTGALKLNGEAKTPDGALLPYVIEGKIDKETVAGTFKFGDREGEFVFNKR